MSDHEYDSHYRSPDPPRLQQNCIGELRVPLNYPADWKFTTIGFAVDQQTVEDFIDLIVSTASGDQSIVETFKMAFGGTAESSSYEWAVEDLRTLAADKANNAAVFVDDLWSGLERCRANHNVPVPEATHVNHILADHGVELVVDPPNLICPNRIDVAEATETGEGTNTGVRSWRRQRVGPNCTTYTRAASCYTKSLPEGGRTPDVTNH